VEPKLRLFVVTELSAAQKDPASFASITLRTTNQLKRTDVMVAALTIKAAVNFLPILEELLQLFFALSFR
jgi:hypothetical protein